MNGPRVAALVRKDLAELAQHPGALVPPVLLMLAAMVPAFLITIVIPAWSGERLDTGEFAAAAKAAAARWPTLVTVTGLAQVQAFLFQQFLLLLLSVPIAGSMAIAAQSVIAEKQLRTLEPLLATPLTTAELLAAKTLTPLLIAAALHVASLVLYASGIALFAHSGVLGAMLNPLTLLLLLGAAPLVTLLALQLAVILSSRVNDARSAQQFGGLLLLPISALFVAQLIGGFLVGSGVLLATIAILALLNLIAAVIGVRVFNRERILLNWK